MSMKKQLAKRLRRRLAPVVPPISPVETLESRCLLSASIVPAIDGSNRNPQHPTWGSAGVQLLRLAPIAYADGISSPAGVDRPSARLISDTVSAHPAGVDMPNSRSMTDMVYVWGQFIDHDLDLTPGGTPTDLFNIAVPTGDPQFDPASTGTQIIPLNRSAFDPTTGDSTTNPRQQVNKITAFLDGSVVYGSDDARAAALRTFTGGHLKTSDGNLLPFNSGNLANANDAHIVAGDQLFLAGDVRANENPELTALQTLFVREHNRLADQFAAKHPHATDEQIYQYARKIVSAEIEHITYDEFLPALLGANAMPDYRGYKKNVNPGIANEFSTAAYRVGHTMLGDDVELVDNNGNPVGSGITLAESFFNPSIIEANGIDTLLKGSTTGTAEEIDPIVVDSVRNFLFGPPGAGGFDLAALNIQRGRDHGLADYNTTRAAYGLARVTSFADITSDTVLQQKLQDLYGSVDNIDLWVGALAENHVAGSSVGPLIQNILVDQFARTRAGDAFWYQRTLRGPDLHFVQSTTLADVITRNTTVENLQSNVFFNADAQPVTPTPPGHGHHHGPPHFEPPPAQHPPFQPPPTFDHLPPAPPPPGIPNPALQPPIDLLHGPLGPGPGPRRIL